MVRGVCSACLVALNKKTFKNKLEEKRFVHKFIFNKLFLIIIGGIYESYFTFRYIDQSNIVMKYILNSNFTFKSDNTNLLTLNRAYR